MFSNGMKATVEATGITNWAVLLWNMSHESQQLYKLQWLKDPIWWLMKKIAWSFNIDRELTHYLWLITSFKLTCDACHCPRCTFLWCHLDEVIVPHQKFCLVVMCALITNSEMDEREIRPPENPHKFSPNLSLRQFFCGPTNFKLRLSKKRANKNNEEHDMRRNKERD